MPKENLKIRENVRSKKKQEKKKQANIPKMRSEDKIFTERWMSLKTKRIKDAEDSERGLRKEDKKTFDWNGLTPEIQERVIRHLVLEDERFLVWPEKRVGREQPDLSVVCKGVRGRVLEVFYGEKSFGISVVTGGLVGKGDCSLTGLAAVSKWAATLDQKWFGMIRKWCFEYEDPRGGGARIRKVASVDDDGEEDESFVVSVQFPEQGMGQNVSFCGPTVEVHRAACCVLPGSEDFGQCVVQHTPMRLNGLIIGAMGEGQRLQADALVGLVKALRNPDMIELVAEARCEPAMVKMQKRRGAISM
ncbi:hypothetical protein AC578_3499 [Pseudocercospora eumusae]|uniref:Uncharacterized protein n=1 Tax=Pseudocercospora eumusae TaxID=321146 RepID=A0A139H9J2_9PEZI|nr:hypothetical protein AC578_3499 [Pseudocercospora eumusae]